MRLRLGFAPDRMLAVAAIAALGCSPDRATVPNDRLRLPDGPAADFANLTPTPILLGKPAFFLATQPILYPVPSTLLLADDFEVPSGAVWTVSAVALTGRLETTSLALSIRADAGGRPGAPVPNGAGTLSLAASDSNTQVRPFQGHGLLDYLFTLPSPLTLPPGTYWLATEIVVNQAGDINFAGTVSSERTGPGVAVSNDNGATWSVGDVGAPAQLTFAVFGTATQTITLAAVTPNPAPVGSTTTVSATAASGLAVALAAGPATVCTLNGTTLSFVSIGTCTITANQAGNAAYSAAPQVAQDVTVTKVSQSITFPAITPNPATVGGSATLSATASSGLAVSYSSLTQSVCAVSGSTVSYIAAGTCTVAADQAGNASYQAAAQEAQGVTVGKAAQAITFTSTPPASPTVGGTYTVTATGGASGNPVTFGSSTPNVCTVAGSTVSFMIGGSCTVTANQTGNANYLAAGQVTQTSTVSKAAQAIAWTAAPPSPAYLNATYTVSATGGASGNAVGFTVGPSNVCAANGNTVRFVGVGTCVIAANQGGNDAYAAAPQVTQSVKVDYRYTGFLDPVRNNGILNVATAGQAVPLKWRLTDASGAPVTTLRSVVLTVKALSCALGSSNDQARESAAGGSGLQNLGDGYYQYNWKVPASYANSCKMLRLDLGEGSGPRTANFAVTSDAQ